MKSTLLFFVLFITNITAFSQCISGDCVNGYGTYGWPNGDKYYGSFVNGSFNGTGTLHHYNGDKYEGDFRNDIPQGKGVKSFNDGNKYIGDFVGGTYQGKGTFFWNNGDKYVGDWVNNVRQGKGIYTYGVNSRNNKEYSGYFINNTFTGYGVMYYLDGSKYEGEWVSDVYQGKGKRTYSSGLVEEGIFVSGTYVGEEKQITQNDSNLISNNNQQLNTNKFPNSTFEDLTVDGGTIKSKLEKSLLDLYSKASAMHAKNSLFNKSTTDAADYLENGILELKETVDGWLGGPMTDMQVAEFLEINKTTMNEVTSTLGLVSSLMKNSGSSSSSSSYSSNSSSSSSNSSNNSVCSMCKPSNSKGHYIQDFDPSTRTYKNGRYFLKPGYKPCNTCKGTGTCFASCRRGKDDCPGWCDDNGTCTICHGDRFELCSRCKGSGK
jgi:hypothetical protein